MRRRLHMLTVLTFSAVSHLERNQRRHCEHWEHSRPLSARRRARRLAAIAAFRSVAVVAGRSAARQSSCAAELLRYARVDAGEGFDRMKNWNVRKTIVAREDM